jgi:hypothetical protein
MFAVGVAGVRCGRSCDETVGLNSFHVLKTCYLGEHQDMYCQRTRYLPSIADWDGKTLARADSLQPSLCLSERVPVQLSASAVGGRLSNSTGEMRSASQRALEGSSVATDSHSPGWDIRRSALIPGPTDPGPSPAGFLLRAWSRCKERRLSGNIRVSSQGFDFVHVRNQAG